MATQVKTPKVFAKSIERYRANAFERRTYGGNTVTRFLVGYEGSTADTWEYIMGYGPTPGERKTFATKQFVKANPMPPTASNPSDTPSE